jgi:hypothetical protein
MFGMSAAGVRPGSAPVRRGGAVRARREPPLEVSAAQRAALEHVRATARRERGAALARLRAVAEIPDLAVLVANVGRHGRVTLNFHPDRLLADGRTIAAAIGEDGRYRSQFETRVSNGARTAFPAAVATGGRSACSAGPTTPSGWAARSARSTGA